MVMARAIQSHVAGDTQFHVRPLLSNSFNSLFGFSFCHWGKIYIRQYSNDIIGIFFLFTAPFVLSKLAQQSA